MFKFTEKVGNCELTYESDTVQGVIDLRNAINPTSLHVAEARDGDEVKRRIDEILCSANGGAMQ